MRFLAITPELKNKIIEKLNQRAPTAICPVCQRDRWTLSDGLTMFILQEQVPGIVIGGPVMPCIAIVCTNCGNTHFLNLFVLGVAEEFGIKPAKADTEGGGGNG